VFMGWDAQIPTYMPAKDLVFVAQWVRAVYEIKFVNYDGTTLQIISVPYGELPIYTGPTPEKAPTKKVQYDFAGWSPAVTVATADVTYVAKFDKNPRIYNITFLDEDGTVLYTTQTPYAEVPVFDLEDPYKGPDAKYYYYFAGWSPKLKKATADAVYTATYGKTPAYRLLATMKSGGKTKLNLTWTKVDAQGYDIYFSQCTSDGIVRNVELFKSITGNKTFKYTIKNLKQGVCYKAVVKAFRTVNGKKVYIAESPMVHAIANATNKQYTNTKSISVSPTTVTLKKGKTKTLKVSLKGVNSKKTVLDQDHAALLRYFSTNTSVATVSTKGKIKAVGKGSCTVIVMSPNGIYKKVTVRVG